MTICGLTISIVSFLIAFIFLVLKLVFWNEFDIGKAPVLIGLFAFSGFQILFLGLLGEYINVILTHVRNLPLVVEQERVNFKRLVIEKKIFINYTLTLIIFFSFVYGIFFLETPLAELKMTQFMY